MRKLMMFALVILLLGLVAVPVTARQDRPFKASGTLVSSVPVSPDICESEGYDLQIAEEWVGTATHLGRYHEYSTLCLELDQVPLVPFTVSGTFEAANGDELTFEAQGVFNVASCTTEGGGFEFTGGTGRFQSATGSGMTVIDRSPPPDCEPLSIVHTGSIDY
jgi:hypothetical protein